jgi:Tfp pilus assembly protein PilF
MQVRRAAEVLLLVGLLVVAHGCQKQAPTPTKPQPSITAETPERTPALITEHNRGVAHMGKFEFAEAQAIFAELAKRYPRWSDVQVDLAIATFNQQKPDESFASQYIVDSLAILDDVLKRDPEHARARYSKGVLLYYLGKTAEARPHFEFVAQQDPADPFAAYFVGRCLFNDGKFEDALAQFQQAIARDPYFSSAHYAAFQSLQRLKRADDAQAMMADFQRLEGNPQARKEAMKYTRMGKKAEVQAIATPRAEVASKPLEFEKTSQLFPTPAGASWRQPNDQLTPPPSLTACDIDGDGRLDLFLAAGIFSSDGMMNAVLLQRENGQFDHAVDHPLATVSDVSAAAWGDFDNDGLTDVYLGRHGANQLWRQTSPNAWEDVTTSTGTAAGDGETVDTMMIDFDHDGDLDLIVLNKDGSKSLLANNRDGTFRAIGEEYGVSIGKNLVRATRILATDLDNDRDVDLVFRGAERSPGAYLNDRLWRFRPDWQLDDFQGYAGRAISLDQNSDGRLELVDLADKLLLQWKRGKSVQWEHRPGDILELPTGDPTDNARRIAAVDFDGDAQWDVAVGAGDRVIVRSLSSASNLLSLRIDNLFAWTIAPLDGVRPSLITFARQGDDLILETHTPKDRSFISLSFSGKEEKQDEMRSNRSGVGVKVNARVGSDWFSAETFRNDSGPGQSLMPLVFGTNGAEQVDFVMLHWSDGVFQTEMNLAADQLHKIEETQRQTSSCPLLFVWDGEKYAFVTDLLGVGGMGFNIGNGDYPPPDPTENLLLPEGLAKPRDGCIALKLHEPMEEVTYLDYAQLAVYDLPPGWQMVLDERFGASDPQPTGEPIYYREEQLPTRVVNDRGEDVTASVSEVDDIAAPPNERDARFIGRTQPSTLELEFATRLPENAVLIADGWVEYPYSQTMFAAWQAGAKYEPPSLEARGADGKWKMVHAQFGYPAGMPRRMALPLENLPPDTTALRISTTYEVYWDRLAVARAEDCPAARRTQLSPSLATLARTGFPRRTNGPQRRPSYDYAHRAPFDDMRYQSGWYTEFGDALPLVSDADDALAIFGPGEEVHLEFAAPSAPHDGWSRRVVLETVGWCKDMDLLTADGDTVAPLPAREPDNTSRTSELHNRYNTRHESGY